LHPDPAIPDRAHVPSMAGVAIDSIGSYFFSSWNGFTFTFSLGLEGKGSRVLICCTLLAIVIPQSALWMLFIIATAQTTSH
jgi:hypothetical protein